MNLFDLLDGFQELLFPPRCLSCGILGEGLCPECKDSFQMREYCGSINTVPVFSSVGYNQVTRRILLAAKEDGVRSADDFILQALHHSLLYALNKIEKHPLLVPIPSTSRAVRKRGRDFVQEISKRLSTLVQLPTQNLLCHNRPVSDQTLLGASARIKNLEGAITLKKGPLRLHEVFLIDDLVTTGATLNEAVRTLEKSGFRVVGAVTALVSLPLR